MSIHLTYKMAKVQVKPMILMAFKLIQVNSNNIQAIFFRISDTLLVHF